MQSVTINDEIKVIENYISLENLRYHKPIQLFVDINDIDIFNIKIPPMFLQPFVENSIIHGFGEKVDEKKVHLTFLECSSYIICIIEDNGVGRKQENNHNRKNSGLKIMKKRLVSIWYNKPQKSIIKIEDLKSEKGNRLGTRVTINLPKYF